MNGKIALLFLTNDDILHFDKFVQYGYTTKGNVYVHPKFPDRVPDTLQQQTTVLTNTVPTKWGDISIVRASLLLLAEAYRNEENEWFILCSWDSYPLKSYDISVQEIIEVQRYYKILHDNEQSSSSISEDIDDTNDDINDDVNVKEVGEEEVKEVSELGEEENDVLQNSIQPLQQSLHSPQSDTLEQQLPVPSSSQEQTGGYVAYEEKSMFDFDNLPQPDETRRFRQASQWWMLQRRDALAILSYSFVNYSPKWRTPRFNNDLLFEVEREVKQQMKGKPLAMDEWYFYNTLLKVNPNYSCIEGAIHFVKWPQRTVTGWIAKHPVTFNAFLPDDAHGIQNPANQGSICLFVRKTLPTFFPGLIKFDIEPDEMPPQALLIVIGSANIKTRTLASMLPFPYEETHLYVLTMVDNWQEQMDDGLKQAAIQFFSSTWNTSERAIEVLEKYLLTYYAQVQVLREGDEVVRQATESIAASDPAVVPVDVPVTAEEEVMYVSPVKEVDELAAAATVDSPEQPEPVPVQELEEVIYASPVKEVDELPEQPEPIAAEEELIYVSPVKEVDELAAAAVDSPEPEPIVAEEEVIYIPAEDELFTEEELATIDPSSNSSYRRREALMSKPPEPIPSELSSIRPVSPTYQPSPQLPLPAEPPLSPRSVSLLEKLKRMGSKVGDKIEDIIESMNEKVHGIGMAVAPPPVKRAKKTEKATERKRCANGTRKNRRTGNCEPYPPLTQLVQQSLPLPLPTLSSSSSSSRPTASEEAVVSTALQPVQNLLDMGNKPVEDAPLIANTTFNTAAMIPTVESVLQLQPPSVVEKRKRCANGTRRNVKTGNCEKK